MYLLVPVGEVFLEEGEVGLCERLAEAGEECGGALGEEGFGHSRLLGGREVGVAALLGREVGGVQPDKK